MAVAVGDPTLIATRNTNSGGEYVLRTVGGQDIKVTFGDEKRDQKIKILQDVYRASMQGMHSDTTHYNMRHVLVSSL